MSETSKPISIEKSPEKKKEDESKQASPLRSPGKKGHFLIPHPLPCKRTRTTSISRLASESPVQEGIIESFCRERGHGFILPDGEKKHIFLHISDIEGDYVAQKGDRVEFRTIPMPPKRVEKQAVEVRLIQLSDEKPHKRWDNGPDIDIPIK